MNIVLWVLQVLLAVAFFAHGWLFLSPPPEIAEQMNASLPRWFQLFLGVAEVLAALGLTLPGLTRIMPWLVTWAAGGIMIVTVSATAYHLHTRLDEWWIYDYFPGALEADRARYLPTTTIRERLEAAGFTEAATELAHHIPAEMPFAVATERVLIDRRSTSQLMVISHAEYDAGLQRLRAEQPTLKADLRLYATIGRVPSTSCE
jgi:uncharacterized membrane protein YphA (DoxX/SURF4 family)